MLTSNKIEFGVRLPVAGPIASPAAIRQVAVRSESLGFDFLSVHDFIAWSRFQDATHISCGSREVVDVAGGSVPPNFYESISTLSYVAGITSKVRLLVSVLAVPYRQPVVAAKQLATVDQLSAGRLIVGIGTGAAKTTHNSDFEVLGLNRADKYSRTVDYVRAMRAVWTEDVAAYDGRYVSFADASIFPKPVQDPLPIWVGGGGPKSRAIAGTVGNGWLPVWISPVRYPPLLIEIESHAKEAGRELGEFAVGTCVHVSLAESNQAAVERARATVGLMGVGFADDATDEAVAASGLVGSADDVAEKINQFIEVGVSKFEFRFIYHSLNDLDDQLELFKSAIAPQLNAFAWARS